VLAEARMRPVDDFSDWGHDTEGRKNLCLVNLSFCVETSEEED